MHTITTSRDVAIPPGLEQVMAAISSITNHVEIEEAKISPDATGTRYPITYMSYLRNTIQAKKVISYISHLQGRENVFQT